MKSEQPYDPLRGRSLHAPGPRTRPARPVHRTAQSGGGRRPGPRRASPCRRLPCPRRTPARGSTGAQGGARGPGSNALRESGALLSRRADSTVRRTDHRLGSTARRGLTSGPRPESARRRVRSPAISRRSSYDRRPPRGGAGPESIVLQVSPDRHSVGNGEGRDFRGWGHGPARDALDHPTPHPPPRESVAPGKRRHPHRNRDRDRRRPPADAPAPARIPSPSAGRPRPQPSDPSGSASPARPRSGSGTRDLCSRRARCGPPPPREPGRRSGRSRGGQVSGTCRAKA